MIGIYRGVILEQDYDFNFQEIQNQCAYDLIVINTKTRKILGIELSYINAEDGVRYREIEPELDVSINQYLFELFFENNIEFREIGTWIIELKEN